MYELDLTQLARARERLEEIYQRTGRAPVLVPLGVDPAGVWHYRVLTVREDNTLSDHVASFGQATTTDQQTLRELIKFADCTCDAGRRGRHCYQVAFAYPVHRTFLLLDQELRAGFIN